MAFKKGESGNPKGKPKGARHKTTELAYAMMEGGLEAVLQQVVERAKSGDMLACRMIIDKIIPSKKDRTVAIDLPAISTLDGVGRAQSEILQAVVDGDITPNEGERISSIVEARRRVIETVELEARIAELEGKK
jgi:hypothetical protein